MSGVGPIPAPGNSLHVIDAMAADQTDTLPIFVKQF
jgi:hypothetical protein